MMRGNLARAAAGATLAAVLGLGAVVAPVATASGPVGLTAAQAVPYAMPVGTWGGLCGRGDVRTFIRYERHGVALYSRWHRTQWNNRWSGSRWECRIRYSYDYLLLVA